MKGFVFHQSFQMVNGHGRGRGGYQNDTAFTVVLHCCFVVVEREGFPGQPLRHPGFAVGGKTLVVKVVRLGQGKDELTDAFAFDEKGGRFPFVHFQSTLDGGVFVFQGVAGMKQRSQKQRVPLTVGDGGHHPTGAPQQGLQKDSFHLPFVPGSIVFAVVRFVRSNGTGLHVLCHHQGECFQQDLQRMQRTDAFVVDHR